MKILFSGDFCPVGRNEQMLKSGQNVLSPEIFEYWQAADKRVINLECVVTNGGNKIVKTGPHLKVDPTIIAGFAKLQVSLCALANNHILDYATKGLQDTLHFCAQANVATTGAGLNFAEASKPFVFQQGETRVAIVNVTENEFSTTDGNHAGAHAINPVKNFSAIRAAADQADFVVVVAHGGKEHYNLPAPSLRDLYRFYVDTGACAVIGHHPHCFSGYEIYKNAPICYSLGNFVFDHDLYRDEAWCQGFLATLAFSPGQPVTLDILPYKQGEKDDPTVRALIPEERAEFDARISELNEVIRNDDLLERRWQQLLKQQRHYYRNISLISSPLLRKAVSKGWVKSSWFTSPQHTTFLLNMVRCETHRDILISSLSEPK